MATNTQLMHSLPQVLYYLGEPYYLLWQASQLDSRCVVIGYVDSTNSHYLSIGSDYFYVETERHYATFTMLQVILYHAQTVLEEVWFQNPNMYNKLVDGMYNNSVILQNYCNIHAGQIQQSSYTTQYGNIVSY